MQTEACAILSALIDADRCVDTLSGIWENDRLFEFSAFKRTAGLCARLLKGIGLTEVERLPLRADGATCYGDWVIPQAWDARAAHLRLLSPYEEKTPFAAYPEIPCSLVMYSAPTPPEGVCARVLLADSPEVLDGMDVRGALLMTGLRPQALLSRAQAGGAVGIISDHMPLYPGVRDMREDVYNAFRWENGFAVPRNQTGLFAFSLSPRRGECVRRLLSSDAHVEMHAVVDTRLYDGDVETVSGYIPGTGPEEVLGFGHLYEPGAHDNASGCAALIEAARTLRLAIDKCLLPRPRRGIRIAMGFECAGSMGYFQAHPERIARTRAGLVADMVGTQAADRTRLSIWHNPLSNRARVDTLIVDLLRDVERESGMPFPFEERPFSIGTDNILADPCFGMPTVALIAEPALSYHSSMDELSRIEKDIQARNTLLAALYLYTVADAPEEWLTGRPAIDAPDSARTASDIIPVRRVMGCLTLEAGARLKGMTPDERARWQPAWNGRLNIPLFWADGKRTLGEIAYLSARELSITDAAAYETELREYFAFLERHGYVSFA